MIGSTSFLMANKEIIRLTDIETAILYSDLAGAHDYWSEKSESQDGYFYRTQNEIELNTTLSPKVQLRCLRLLEEKGLIKTKLRGLPAKKYFCIDNDCMYRLSQVLQKGETCLSEMYNQDKQKCTNMYGVNVETSLVVLDNQDCTKRLINNNRINNNKEIIIENNKGYVDFEKSNHTNEILDLENSDLEPEYLEAEPIQKRKKIAPKKEKETVKIYPLNYSSKMIQAADSFFEYRNEIKKPLKSKKSLSAKINEWSRQIDEYGEQAVIESINNAIANGYQGTFIKLNNNQKFNNNGTNIHNTDSFKDFLRKGANFEL